ncbi:MAG: hypothetical protein GY711_09715 [bacterium]|nr:hypothetical protein [bacterium]
MITTLLRPIVPLLLLAAQAAGQGEFALAVPPDLERAWVGPTVWANRLQDWRIAAGRVECVEDELALRTLHLLTHRVGQEGGGLEVEVRTGLIDGDIEALGARAASGILIGAGAPDLDWRSACLVQSAPGPDGGYLVGIDGAGRLFVSNFALAPNERRERRETAVEVGRERLRDVRLRARIQGAGRFRATLVATAHDPETGEELARIERTDVAGHALAGNLALVANPARGETRGRFWFRDWRGSGERLVAHPERHFGPIAGAQHTLSRGRLKMTAQLFPIAANADRSVALETDTGSGWVERARAGIVFPGYTAHFAVDDWDATRDTPYRVVYGEATYAGTVRRDPTDVSPIILAGLSCNHLNRHGFGTAGYPWNEQALWFPHAETVRHVGLHAPHLLFFAGDQIYEGASPTFPDRQDPYLDYLYKWTLFLWAFGDLLRDVPAVTIPDDHDVYQGNLWGAGGRATRRDNEGGYVMPAEWVKMVERTQTAHLPDPWSTTPLAQGLSSYYTGFPYGRISWAVLEDRKFKSGPKSVYRHDGPRPDHVTDPDFDPRAADVRGATLLGDEQLAFLQSWSADWRDVDMKVALMQSVFAGLATHHGADQQYLLADFDCNGWPQTGRNRALMALRKGFALMVGGDQHLSTLAHHGIEEFDDAGWSFVVPAIANFYARSWLPPTPAIEPLGVDLPAYTGRYHDGFGNKVSVWAATNPHATGRTPAALHDAMPGYGIVRLDKATRSITIESWPRGIDPRVGKPYAGWPKTISQRSGYGRRVHGVLPEMRFVGGESPVVQVVHEEDGEAIYTIRANGDRFMPFVFEEGEYSVIVGKDAPTDVALTGATVADGGSVEVRLK